jgi:hypothetical protein
MPDSAPVTPAQPGQVPAQPGTPTPVSPVPVQPGTPTPPTVDVEAIKAEYEGKLKQYERDLNRMKGSLQRNQSQAERAAQQRQEELEVALEAERVSHMDEAQRKEYERLAALDRAQELEQQLNDARSTAQEQIDYNKAYVYFTRRGVPADALVLDQGYQALFESGWEFINIEFDRLRSLQAAPPAPAAPPTPPGVNAPRVPATGATPVTGGNTWADIRTKYGSEDNFMRLVRRGRVPETEIPGYTPPAQ